MFVIPNEVSWNQPKRNSLNICDGRDRNAVNALVKTWLGTEPLIRKANYICSSFIQKLNADIYRKMCRRSSGREISLHIRLPGERPGAIHIPCHIAYQQEKSVLRYYI